MIRRQRRDRDGGRLVAESEAFLAGAYAEHIDNRGEAVPAWAWINVLAHGTAEQLRDVASKPAMSAWGDARRFLAGEILDIVDGGQCRLPDLQRSALVPLELGLVSGAESARVRPGDVVGAVLGSLPKRRTRP